MPRNIPAPTQPATRNWLDYESGSIYLGISVRALQRLVREKKIGCTRLGKRTLFSQSQLDEFIAACTVNPAARATGMPDLKLHELRHTFATLVLESGAFDMFQLSRLMGHASVSITDKVYAHLRKKDYSAQRAMFSAFVSGVG